MDSLSLYIYVCCFSICSKPMPLGYFFSVVAISFSPQNYTVPEGTPADIMIVLDKPSPKDITITFTTMDITAQGNCEICLLLLVV